MAAKNQDYDFSGGYDFGPLMTPRQTVSPRLLGGTTFDKGEVRGSRAYTRFPQASFEAYDTPDRPIPKRLAGKSRSAASHYDSFLEGLGDDAPSAAIQPKAKFGRVRTGITGVPAVDQAIFDVQDQLDDLKAAMTLQSAAAVFTIGGLAWLILRGK